MAPPDPVLRWQSLQPWLKELLPALVPLLGLPLLVALFASTPASPWALHRADALLAAGDLPQAVVAYERVARWAIWPGQSREATWRAANLAGESVRDPIEARRLYRTFLRAWPEDPRIAQARVALARIEWRDFSRPDRAARQFTWAVRAAPAAPEAATWLQRAGEAWVQAERLDQARAVWTRLIAEHPDHAAPAQLALARLALTEGEVEQAFGFFQAVAVSRSRGAEATLARLGMSLCLEQLGDLEAALAELDEVSDELPLEVWQQRRERLIERQREAGGESP